MLFFTNLQSCWMAYTRDVLLSAMTIVEEFVLVKQEKNAELKGQLIENRPCKSKKN